MVALVEGNVHYVVNINELNDTFQVFENKWR